MQAAFFQIQTKAFSNAIFPGNAAKPPRLKTLAAALVFGLDKLGVELDFSVVGEELGDGAAGLGIGGGLVEDFFRRAGNAGRCGERDLGDREAPIGFR